jgi:transcriptional regulator with XRE-family HTH domain
VPPEITLQELRRRLTVLSQEQVAERLGVSQGQVSKLERKEDMLVSQLCSFVEALGGRVEIRACFPGRAATIRLAREAEEPEAEPVIVARARQLKATYGSTWERALEMAEREVRRAG